MRSGDVQAVLAIVVAVGLGLWGALVLASLLFGKKAGQAAKLLSEQPGKQVGKGAFLGVLGIGVGIAVMQLGGLGMLLGWVLLFGTLLIALIGSTGMVELVSERIQPLSPASPFASRVRAAGLIVLTGLLPGFGWLLLFPLQLFAGLGAGVSVLLGRKQSTYEPLPLAQTQQQ